MIAEQHGRWTLYVGYLPRRNQWTWDLSDGDNWVMGGYLHRNRHSALAEGRHRGVRLEGWV